MGMNRRDMILSGAGLTAALTSAAPAQAQQGISWAREADLVVIGSGACGMTAAIRAREAGASVIIVEAEPHVGGHAMVCGGNVPLGGGTAAQKKHGIEDTPDKVFRDLTDWSVVERNGFPNYRYNDREVIRAFADNSAATFDFLVKHGVVFVDKAPDAQGGAATGNSVPRVNHAAIMDWHRVQTGKQVDPSIRKTFSSGNGLMRPLEASARKLGVEILTEHRMTSIIRQSQSSGPVIGIAVDNKGQKLNIKARKAVVIGTGGSTGNVNFRRIYDPRLTEEYCAHLGAPYSQQDASGEIAAMGIGASLWGVYNQVGEFGGSLIKNSSIGSQYGYPKLGFVPGGEVFGEARASGLDVADWQNLITVNMIGKRFYDETGGGFTANNYRSLENYTQDSWLNAKNVRWNPNNWINAALAGIGDGHNGGGPIWAIFDADAVAREKWNPIAPQVDFENGFFFKADTIADLARAIRMKYQRVPMPVENLEETVARYNSFVDKGVDEDFAKPTPKFKIAKAPFYAAWATPMPHDTRAGLRINAKCQVVDLHGEVIPGLYCGGESAGGFSQHGTGRATCQGYIAGGNAVNEPVKA